MLIFDRVSLRYGEKTALDGVSFTLRPHRLTALVGPNGSGKSSLLSCVNQQLRYTGRILEGEKDLTLLPPRERARLLAILPQTLPAPHITGRELVALGRSPYLDYTGRLTRADREAVEQALADVRGETLAHRYADSFSGGELQRLLLGMILAQNTPILLLDEPTAHMDPAYEAQLLSLLRDLTRRRKKTVLVILHDLNQAMEYADDLVVLKEGKLCFAGSKAECLDGRILEQTFCVHRYTAMTEDTQRIFFASRGI